MLRRLVSRFIAFCLKAGRCNLGRLGTATAGCKLRRKLLKFFDRFGCPSCRRPLTEGQAGDHSVIPCAVLPRGTLALCRTHLPDIDAAFPNVRTRFASR
jgi:hypothetical protein